jgi:hypothetical protein
MCEFSLHLLSETLPILRMSEVQGGSNMTGTDLCVNKPHYVAAVRPWESEATTSTSLLLGLEPVQSCLGVARVMNNYGYKKNQSRSYLNHLVLT